VYHCPLSRRVVIRRIFCPFLHWTSLGFEKGHIEKSFDMTILSQVYFDANSWSPFGEWRTVDPFRFNRWNEQYWNSYAGFPFGNGVSIPIAREESQRYRNYIVENDWEMTDSDSDSEWDDDDLNHNSLPMKRKRKLEGTQRPSSSPKPGTSTGSSSQSPTPSKQKCNGTRVKNGSSEPISIDDSVTTLPTKHYKTRSTAGNKDVVFVDDEENQINEITSYDVYKHLKTLLQKSERCIDEMKGDGNCFFRALSKVVFSNQRFYDDIRQSLVDLIEKYPRKFEAVTDGPVSSHIHDMRQDKTWATQTEIYAAATLFGRSIYVLSPDQTGEIYRWLLFSPLFKYHTGKLNDPCYITICHTHGNHYDRIAPLKGKCNCELKPPELSGIKDSVDLTVDENEIV